jgi:hypothetical protein
MDNGQGIFEQVNARTKEELDAKKRFLENAFPKHGCWPGLTDEMLQYTIEVLRDF